MKARRKAHVVVSDDEQAEEEQGRNLMQELDLDAQVPTHLESQRRSNDRHVSETFEEQLEVFSAAKVLAESAKKRRNVENVQIYTRRSKTDSTGRGRFSTASRKISTADDSTASVEAKYKGKEIMQETEPTKN